MPQRQIAPFFAFAAACYLVAPYLGLSSFDVDPRIAEVWPPGRRRASCCSPRSGSPARRVVVADPRASWCSSSSVTAVLMGYDLAPSLWLALVGAAQPLLMVWLYRRQLEPHRLGAGEPAGRRRPAVRGRRLLAAPRRWSAASPSSHPSDLPSKVLLWWVLRNTVFCFVGGATFMVIFYGAASTVPADQLVVQPGRAAGRRLRSASTAPTTTRPCRCRGC